MKVVVRPLFAITIDTACAHFGVKIR